MKEKEVLHQRLCDLEVKHQTACQKLSDTLSLYREVYTYVNFHTYMIVSFDLYMTTCISIYRMYICTYVYMYVCIYVRMYVDNNDNNNTTTIC